MPILNFNIESCIVAHLCIDLPSVASGAAKVGRIGTSCAIEGELLFNEGKVLHVLAARGWRLITPSHLNV